jgi:hypothetical protein
MSLKETLSKHYARLQHNLFPEVETALGALTEKQTKLITVLESVEIERFLPHPHGYVGRPCAERAALARAYVAKAVYDLPTTRLLIDVLKGDVRLRRICGWERRSDVPEEWTFSRAFAEFTAYQLPARLHEALVKTTLGDHLIGHISRDSTAIESREKPISKPKQLPKQPKKRGRPRKGEEAPVKDPTRIERQKTMSLKEMVAELPQPCDCGTKRNAKGYKESWIGYKLHIDTADGDIPVSAILTSASVHDGQVALPLAAMTAMRVTNLYDLMDSAYDDENIREASTALGHIAIIDINPRRDVDLAILIKDENKAKRVINHPFAEDIRYRQRSSAERINSQLKDNLGGTHIRVRGNPKVFTHLMFGLLSLTALQLMRLVT